MKTLTEQVIRLTESQAYMHNVMWRDRDLIPISAILARVDYWQSLACGNTETNARVIAELKALEGE